MPSGDPFAQTPVTRPGAGGTGRQTRPPINPVSTAMRRPTITPSSGGLEKEGTAADHRLNRLKVVPIDLLEGSPYQHRDELNVAEDKEYQQLRAQVQADLESQPDPEHRTIEHVFIVMPNPHHEGYFLLASGGHRRYQVCLDLGVKEVYVGIVRRVVQCLSDRRSCPGHVCFLLACVLFLVLSIA